MNTEISQKFKDSALRAIEIEREAIHALPERIDDHFRLRGHHGLQGPRGGDRHGQIRPHW